jgi:arylformamidase
VSGIFDLAHMRGTSRNQYINFDDQIEQLLSPQRQLSYLTAPLLIAVGSSEPPGFQQQARDFAKAVTCARMRADFIIGESYNHFEMAETFGSPYGVVGRALLHHLGQQA